MNTNGAFLTTNIYCHEILIYFNLFEKLKHIAVCLTDRGRVNAILFNSCNFSLKRNNLKTYQTIAPKNRDVFSIF